MPWHAMVQAMVGITDDMWWHVMTRVDVDSFSWCTGLDCDYLYNYRWFSHGYSVGFGGSRLMSAYVGSALFFHAFSIFWPCHALPGRSNSGSELWELIQLCEMNEAQLFHHSAWQTFNPDPVHPVNPCHSSAMAVVAVDVTAKHWDNMAAGKKKHIISFTSVKCAKTCCMHNRAGMSLTPHSLVCLLSASPPLSRSVAQRRAASKQVGKCWKWIETASQLWFVLLASHLSGWTAP